MPALVRHVASLVALLACVGGMARVQPCVDDDRCATSCNSTAAQACPASGGHHDPAPPAHSCDCLCHVPGVTRVVPAVVRPDAPMEVASVPIRARACVGFLEPPFHPPRA